MIIITENKELEDMISNYIRNHQDNKAEKTLLEMINPANLDKIGCDKFDYAPHRCIEDTPVCTNCKQLDADCNCRLHNLNNAKKVEFKSRLERGQIYTHKCDNYKTSYESFKNNQVCATCDYLCKDESCLSGTFHKATPVKFKVYKFRNRCYMCRENHCETCNDCDKYKRLDACCTYTPMKSSNIMDCNNCHHNSPEFGCLCSWIN